MERKEYNGWTNYETWCVALWMDNEEGSQSYNVERAEECCRDVVRDEGEKAEASHALAERLESDHDETRPEVSGVFADLLGAALSEVNWYEIAEHYVDEVWDEIKAESADEEESVPQ